MAGGLHRFPSADADDAARGDRPRGDRLEIGIAALLGVVAILTAVATYKAVVEDGDTLASYNEGIRLTDQSSQRDTAGTQEYSTDQATYLEYIKSDVGGENEIASYFRKTLFSPQLEEGVKWVEDGPEEAISPFQEESPYTRPEWAEAEQLRTFANSKFKEAGLHDENGDKYVLATVILSIALFLLGIAGVNRQYRVQRVLTGIAVVVLVAGVVQILAVAL